MRAVCGVAFGFWHADERLRTWSRHCVSSA